MVIRWSFNGHSVVIQWSFNGHSIVKKSMTMNDREANDGAANDA